MQDKLLETKLPVAYIKTDDINEVRDLFVRLQSGRPLNPQEKRDSYPGEFTEFILKLGGKPALARFPGHAFFQDVLKMRPGQDNGKTRQLAAQIAILFFKRRQTGGFSDINAAAIDDYYYANLDFDPSSPGSVRLRKILDLLTQRLGGWSGPRLQAHNAIHLVLFVDSIMDDYTHSWEADLEYAQQQFSLTLTKAAIASRQGKHDEAWLEYGQWTRTAADRAWSISKRHQYYSARMMEFLGDLTPKDPNRAFNLLEKEAIYWRDEGMCQVCGEEVDWEDAEVHHVKEHRHGGRTELSNGVLVHKHDHPKGQAALEFAKTYQGPGLRTCASTSGGLVAVPE